MVKPIWNNAQRVNHQNFAKKTHPCAKKNLVPRAVLMKSGLVSVNTARQVNVAHSKTIVNAARPMSNLSKIAYSTVKRPIHKDTTFKNSNINQRVNTVRGKKFNTARPKAIVNAVKGNNFNAIKASAWNMSYLTNYEEIDGGYVAFGGNLKGGKITGKCTIKTSNLDIENVYFVRELKFNLFSVSQMCDKKNSVLFNDTECIVLSPNFKLIDESQVLLRVPRKNNMYSVDLKNIVPKGGTKASDNAGQARKETEPIKTYILLPLWTADPPYSHDLKSSHDDGSKPSSDDGNKVDEDPRKESELEEDGIFISQDKYVVEILKKFGFTEVKTASTPMETKKPLLKDEDGEEVDVHMYRSIIGSLMYLTSSRPDIMFAVCACARYQVNPKVSHLYAVKRIFRYLKGQPKLGLWYLKDSPFDLVAYTDNDYVGASLDKKSITRGKAKKSVKLMMEKLFRMELELMLVTQS
ncbi:hypothetical protein Tco_0218060 [Tanacetum coccineum]